MTNFLVFVAGSLIATLIGFILDGHWVGKLDHGIRVYTLETYQIALAAFPITMLFAFIFTFFIKEKKKSWCANR